MTRRIVSSVLLVVATAAGLACTPAALADGGCRSPYVWGRDSYFGDRWVYSYRHAYPETTYRSSRYFIYSHRVPHFYESSTTLFQYDSNYYTSPEYQAYYTHGPYTATPRYYDPQKYNSPATRPFIPYCPGDADSGDAGGAMNRNDGATWPPADRAGQPVAQPAPANDKPEAQPRFVVEAGVEQMQRAWDLLSAGNCAEAMPAFAQAALLRTDDALPRLGYGLAAAVKGDDMIAAWALDRALSADGRSLTRVSMNDAMREQLEGALHRLTNNTPANVHDQAQADVVTTVLAALVGNDEAMRASLTRLAAGNDRAATRTLALAVRGVVAQRAGNEISEASAAVATTSK